MNFRQKVYRLFGFQDISMTSLLLLMIITALGCSTRDGGASKKDENSDTPSTGNSKASKKDGADRSKITQTVQKVLPPGTQTVPNAEQTRSPLRIVRNDPKASFLVTTSLPDSVNSQYHLREIMVNPYFNELFACGRAFAQSRDNQIYQVHFQIRDGRQIVFQRLMAASRIKGAPPAANHNTKAARCLLGLYSNAVVELSGAVTFTEFSLSFDFQK